MKRKTFSIITALFLTAALYAQTENKAILEATKMKSKISRFVYSHFSEHLGHCIYEGLWMGENSPIPNNKGIRTDVAGALKQIKIPALRWPGGCFADEYHWKDGIGPKNERPKMINTNWGGVTEDNSFGTHEFLELCDQLGCEAYISGNIGSGTVQEMSQWVEYLNSDNESPMTDLRKANGREKSWGVKFWGVGNESWGCGGRMKPGYYSDQALQYSAFLKNHGDNRLKLIAVGPNSADYKWTETLMQEMGIRFWGLALHYYTSLNASATNFAEDEWFKVMKSTLFMEELISKHSAIMDQFDPFNNMALVVDEWGTWYQVEPGTNPRFLFQLNSLRDALVTGINLNIFNNHCNRIKMTAIAQIVNVLQSVILTQGEKMVLTPTYHVFDMYKVHHDAFLIPSSLESDNYIYEVDTVPALNISSSLDQNGKIHISVCNLHAQKTEDLTCQLKGYKASSITGQILTADKLNAHNSFDKPNTLTIQPFSEFSLDEGNIEVKMPPHSVVVLEVTGNLNIPDNSVKVNNAKPGLKYSMYKGSWYRLPDFTKLNIQKEGTVPVVEYPEEVPVNDIGLVFSGFIKIEKTGMYVFTLASDDGSKKTIGEEMLVSNDGRHAINEVEGSIFLHEGYHPITVEFFQASGGCGLQLFMQGIESDRVIVPENIL
ncbi:MAG: alpha-N-arabinofuranosidase [Bacteroidales bacterium]|nr:alpha-N-arabinofuranosidase [Bacteroidales bacterium]